MGKRSGFWDSLPVDGDGEIQWPTDAAARAQLLSDLCGARIIGAVDQTFLDALKQAEGTRPPAGSTDYAKKEQQAAILATLTAEQRSAVVELLRETAYFALYWPLVKLQGCGFCRVRLTASPRDTERSDDTIALNASKELPWLVQEWVDRFSDVFAKPAPRRSSNR